MGAFFGVLGAVERRSRYTTLKYKGIPDTMFDNVCYPSAGKILGQLDHERMKLTDQLSVMLEEAKKAPKWYRKQASSAITEARTRLNEFRRLTSEIELDLSRYSLPLNTPVCLSMNAEATVHEVVHAAIHNVLPKTDESGRMLSTNKLMVRMLIVRRATQKFLKMIGPKSNDFFLLVHPHLKMEHSEEVVAGLAGLVLVVAKQAQGVDVSTKWSDVLDAFVSYTKDIPAHQFDPAAVAAAREWYAKYGSSLAKAMRDFQLDVKAVRAQMDAQPKAQPYQAVKS